MIRKNDGLLVLIRVLEEDNQGIRNIELSENLDEERIEDKIFNKYKMENNLETVTNLNENEIFELGLEFCDEYKKNIKRGPQNKISPLDILMYFLIFYKTGFYFFFLEKILINLGTGVGTLAALLSIKKNQLDHAIKKGRSFLWNILSKR